FSNGNAPCLKHDPRRITGHNERGASFGYTLYPQIFPFRPVADRRQTFESSPRFIRIIVRQRQTKLLQDEGMQSKHGARTPEQCRLFGTIANRFYRGGVKAAIADAAV